MVEGELRVSEPEGDGLIIGDGAFEEGAHHLAPALPPPLRRSHLVRDPLAPLRLVEREPLRERLARVPETTTEAWPLAKGRAQLYVRAVVARIRLEPALQLHDFGRGGLVGHGDVLVAVVRVGARVGIVLGCGI